jgi:hypothetical protein
MASTQERETLGTWSHLSSGFGEVLPYKASEFQRGKRTIKKA